MVASHPAAVARSGRRLAARGTWTVLLVAGALLLAGCGGASPAASVASVSATDSGAGFKGDRLSQPVALTGAATSTTFQSTAGGTTTLTKLQQGHVMVVYYGYTHCPDVCPTTMADLATALRKGGPALQKQTQVVFITSDPQRDTVPVMATWLAHFDGGLATPFVGLTASADQIDAVAKTMGVPLSPPVVHPDGTVTVEHGAQTLPFVNGKAPLVWLASTQPNDYLHDLRKLAAAV